MKIGLIHPFYTYDVEKKNRPFPFGIAYIASFVMEKGHKAEILDLNTTYLSRQEIIDTLKRMNCDIFGVSSLSGGFTYVKNLIFLLKSNFNVPVIVGGPLGMHNFETVLKNTKADICVIGQGEETVYKILQNPGEFHRIQGIAYKDEQGKIIKNSEAPLISLDDIPWPAYQIMSMKDYIWDGASPDMDSKRRYKKGLRVMQMITGRGCPMGCNFCSKVMGRRTLIRSVDKITEEIKFLIKEYGINCISFRDELYILNRQHAVELSGRLKDLNIIWMGQGRVDRVDYDLVKYMKDCGCISLGFGIESGSQKMLNLMNKGQTVEQIENAVKICRKLDMDMKVQLVMGYPGEDRNTIRETVELFKRVGNPGRRFHLITPLPGSVLYDNLIRKGVIGDEAAYLDELSKRESGFSTGLPLINLTQFSDKELRSIKFETESAIEKNYRKYLWSHPLEICRYFRDRLIYKRYLFHPEWLIFALAEKVSSFLKIKGKSSENKSLKLKLLEYQLSA